MSPADGTWAERWTRSRARETLRCMQPPKYMELAGR